MNTRRLREPVSFGLRTNAENINTAHSAKSTNSATKTPKVRKALGSLTSNVKEKPKKSSFQKPLKFPHMLDYALPASLTPTEPSDIGQENFGEIEHCSYNYRKETETALNRGLVRTPSELELPLICEEEDTGTSDSLPCIYPLTYKESLQLGVISGDNPMLSGTADDMPISLEPLAIIDLEDVAEDGGDDLFDNLELLDSENLFSAEFDYENDLCEDLITKTVL